MTEFYGFQTNMVAEAKSLLGGVKWCEQDGIVQLDIEVDSLILVEVLKGEVECVTK